MDVSCYIHEKASFSHIRGGLAAADLLRAAAAAAAMLLALRCVMLGMTVMRRGKCDGEDAA
jgi:hypothetical protein